MTRLIKGLPASHFVDFFHRVTDNQSTQSFHAFEDIVKGPFFRLTAIGYCREKTEEEKKQFKSKYYGMDKS